MTQPTSEQALALQHLRGNTHVVEYLQGCLDERKAKLITLQESEDFRVCQGQAQAYQNLLSAILGHQHQRSGKR